MKKVVLTFLCTMALSSAFAASCKVSGGGTTVVVSCNCSGTDACAKALAAYKAAVKY